MQFHRNSYCLALLLTLACAPRLLRADGPAAVNPQATSWELTPYRLQLCVVVQPSARLQIRETEFAEQLAAQVQALNGGPWQVSVNQKFALGRNRRQRELPLPDPPPPLETDAGCDKVIFVALHESAGQFSLTAREWDATTRLWNVPVTRSAAQASSLAAEALAAVPDAFGPLVRIEEVADKSTGILARARGGAIPRRDGSLLGVPVGTFLRPVVLQTDKQGQPQPATSAVIPATYLAVLAAASPTGSNRGVLRCGSAYALSGDFFPAYHPAQLRLAVGLAPSALPVRIRLVDADAPDQPLAGYEIQRGTGDASGKKLTPVGVTNQQGTLDRVAVAPGMSWIYVTRGGTVLGGQPVIPGLQSEVVIAVKNDRRRLELAAALAELNDDLLDTLGRLSVLLARQREAVLKRDITLTGRVSQELRAAAGNPRLAARLAELEKQTASTDEASRQRLAPDLQKAKNAIERLQEAVSQAP